MTPVVWAFHPALTYSRQIFLSALMDLPHCLCTKYMNAEGQRLSASCTMNFRERFLLFVAGSWALYYCVSCSWREACVGKREREGLSSVILYISCSFNYSLAQIMSHLMFFIWKISNIKLWFGLLNPHTCLFSVLLFPFIVNLLVVCAGPAQGNICVGALWEIWSERSLPGPAEGQRGS